MKEEVLLRKPCDRADGSCEDLDKFFSDLDLPTPDIKTRYEDWVRGDDRFYTKTGVSDRICPSTGTGLYVEPSTPPAMTSYINCGDHSICIHFNKKDSKEEIIVNTDDLREIYAKAQSWSTVIGDGGNIFDPEIFGGLPKAVINKTVKAILKAIETVDCGEKPTAEAVAMKSAILEIVEKFAK